MARRTACSYAKAAPEGHTGQSGSSLHIESHNTRECTETLSLGHKISESDTFAASVNSIAETQGWWKATSNQINADLLLRFHGNTIATMSSPTGQSIILSKVTQHFHTYPFLLHAVLALTAAHVTYLGGRDGDFAATSFHHTQQALKLYSERLQLVKDRTEMDAMLAACFMLTAIFYLSHDEFNATESWIFRSSDSADRPNWWRVLSGPTLLLQSAVFRANAHESSWLPFIRESQELVRQATTKSGPGDRLVMMLRDLISESHGDNDNAHFEGSTQKNPYLPVLDALAPVLRARFDPGTLTFGPCVDMADFVSLMSFPSRLDSVFVERLSGRDIIALLLVGFWFALLAKLQHCRWWCLRRALTEGRTIYLYLSTVQSVGWKFKETVSILERTFFS